MKTEHWLSMLRRRSVGLAAALLAPAMMVAAPLGAVAQEQQIQVLTLRSYPMAIHQGTCETVVAEPSYDLGFLVPRALYVEGDEVVDDAVYDTGVFDPFDANDFYDLDDPAIAAEIENDVIDENEDFLFDDVDANGFYDYGLDLDDNVILDPVEVVQRPVVWAYENELNDIEAGIAEAEGGDPELEDLRAIPHVLMVHRDTVLDTNYMACGEIEGVPSDDGEIVFAVRPLASATFVGIAKMEADEAGFLGIGGEGGAANVYLIPSSVAQVVGQPPSAGTPVPSDGAQAAATEPMTLVAAETGFEPATLMAPVGEVVLNVENPSGVERTFLIPDLGIEEALAPGETTEVTFEVTEPGTYPFMIEGENELTGELEITE